MIAIKVVIADVNFFQFSKRLVVVWRDALTERKYGVLS